MRVKNGPVISIDGLGWDELLALAKIDPIDDEFYEIPILDTPDIVDVKIGHLADVYRRGYVVFPVISTTDLKGKALMMRKGKRNG